MRIHKLQFQRGYSMVELIVVLSIMAVMSIYAIAALRQESEEGIAKASGKYIASVAQAAQQHVMLNYDTYASVAGAPATVPGVATLLQPTVAELVALGRLPNGFSSNMTSTSQTLRIDLTPINCPGSACQVQILACTTTPVTLGGPNVRFDLASTMVAAQDGGGAQSLYGNGNLIRGPQFNPGVANPLGNVQGIVCGTSAVDLALYQNFVRMNDSRNPNLQGDLTVAGTVTVKTRLDVGPCIKMDGTVAGQGRAQFGCADGSLPAGYTGGVRSVDVVANKNLLASATPATFTGAAGERFSLVTADNGAGEAEIKTSGRAVGDRLMPTGAYAEGTACNLTDDGAIAKRVGVGTGLVICQNGFWKVLTATATKGDACAIEGMTAQNSNGVGLLCVNGAYRQMDEIIPGGIPGVACARPGSTGIDTANANELLVCRANPDPMGGGPRWFRIRDLISNLSFVNSVEVGEGSVIGKPLCTPAAGGTSVALLQLLPKTFSSPNGGFAVYADNGASWTVRLRDGDGNVLPGTSSAIAQVYCYFP